jgi:hypothetical protein
LFVTVANAGSSSLSSESKKAHKVTKLAIKKDPLCEENWWQAEIPKGKDDLRSHVGNEPET